MVLPQIGFGFLAKPGTERAVPVTVQTLKLPSAFARHEMNYGFLVTMSEQRKARPAFEDVILRTFSCSCGTGGPCVATLHRY
jgi:hypothetical protein